MPLTTATTTMMTVTMMIMEVWQIVLVVVNDGDSVQWILDA